MKKSYMSAAALLLGAGLMVSSCGGPKTVAQAANEVEISVPCDDQRTNTEFFRGQGVGQSRDLNTARDKARMAANTELAGSISTLIKQVSEKYVNDAGLTAADYSGTFETLGKQVISQQISNVSVSCNKTFQTQDGMYKVYMAVEANKTEVFQALERGASSQKKLETIFNREKFRQTFDAEMEIFAQNYNN